MSAQAFIVKQGQKWETTVLFTAVGLDFTGTLVRSKIRVSADAEAVIHSFTPVVSLAAGGAQAVLSLTPEESLALAVGTYVGDVWIEVPGVLGPYGPIDYTLTVIPSPSRL